MTQLGYGAGLFFVVSLADRVENGRPSYHGGACLGQSGIWMASGAVTFLLFSVRYARQTAKPTSSYSDPRSFRSCNIFPQRALLTSLSGILS